LWKKANTPDEEAHSTSIPGVTIEHFGESPDDDVSVVE
jgi:hypothetical protein